MARHPSIGQVRSVGLIIGIEFEKDRATFEEEVTLLEKATLN